LNIRNKFGVTVIAAVRDGRTEINPTPDFRLQNDDIMVLLGAPEKIDLAMKLFESETV
jgi:K+/H+ antiporter YhaU regulatory subunit KhtT